MVDLASKNGVTHPKKKIEFSHFPLVVRFSVSIFGDCGASAREAANPATIVVND